MTLRGSDAKSDIRGSVHSMVFDDLCDFTEARKNEALEKKSKVFKRLRFFLLKLKNDLGIFKMFSGKL